MNTEYIMEGRDPYFRIGGGSRLGVGNPRPPLSEKLFPVDRPSGFKRADWNFCFHIFEKSLFFSPKKSVQSSQ